MSNEQGPDGYPRNNPAWQTATRKALEARSEQAERADKFLTDMARELRAHAQDRRGEVMGCDYCDEARRWPIEQEQQSPGLAYAIGIEWPEALFEFAYSAFKIRWYRQNEELQERWHRHALAACVVLWGIEMRAFARSAGHCRCGNGCKPLIIDGDD